MYTNQIFAQIEGNGIVRNLVVGDSYTDANHATKMIYGEDAFAVEATLYPIRMEDVNEEKIVYENERFYKADDERIEIVRNPTEEERIEQLTAENEQLKGMVSPVYTLARMQAGALPDDQALQVPDLYDAWSGDSVPYKTGTRVRYDGTLYRVLKDHTSQADWTPDQTPSLYVVIDAEHAGTQEDPIPYKVNMIVYEGKYYMYEAVLYRCTRDSGTALQYTPDQLIGHYFELAEE